MVSGLAGPQASRPHRRDRHLLIMCLDPSLFPARPIYSESPLTQRLVRSRVRTQLVVSCCVLASMAPTQLGTWRDIGSRAMGSLNLGSKSQVLPLPLHTNNPLLGLACLDTLDQFANVLACWHQNTPRTLVPILCPQLVCASEPR